MTSAHVWILCSVTLLLPALPGLYAYSQEKRADTVWDGVYGEFQARRGADVYDDHCSRCHASDLSGDTPYNPSPQLVGRPFMLRWQGKHLDELFTVICRDMPANEPGTLGPRECVDVMAFIFKRNRFPSADADLPADVEALSGVKITLDRQKK